MSQRRHYGFERRQREAARRAKQEAKRQRKTERTADGRSGPDMGEQPEIGAQPGQWEWFSPSRTRIVTSPAGVRPEEDPPDDWILLTDADEESRPPA
jgi:hypothetical protein